MYLIAVEFILLIKDKGILFVIGEQTVKLRGTLVAVSADNPAANLIAGYKSLTSAFRKCRSCMAVEKTMQTKVYIIMQGYMFIYHNE